VVNLIMVDISTNAIGTFSLYRLITDPELVSLGNSGIHPPCTIITNESQDWSICNVVASVCASNDHALPNILKLFHNSIQKARYRILGPKGGHDISSPAGKIPLTLIYTFSKRFVFKVQDKIKNYRPE
jgi:hypothetical protein